MKPPKTRDIEMIDRMLQIAWIEQNLVKTSVNSDAKSKSLEDNINAQVVQKSKTIQCRRRVS